MRYWVQFMAVDLAGVLSDALGTDGVFILDGRNDQRTMRDDALKRAQRFEHFKKFDAFRICTGPCLFTEARATKPEALVYPIRVAG